MKNSIAKQVVKLSLLALVACYSQFSLAGGYYTCGSTQYATSPGKCPDGSMPGFHARAVEGFTARPVESFTARPMETYHSAIVQQNAHTHPITPKKIPVPPSPAPASSPEQQRITNLRIFDINQNA